MRRIAVVALLMLAACSKSLSPAEQAAQDARDVAMVEKANRGAGVPIAPQPILLPDMQANSLFGTGCAFVAKSAGVGAVMLARADGGYLKLDDAVVRFAADTGSKALPYGVYARYAGKRYAFELSLASEKPRRTGMESSDYDGRLRVQDAKGHIVYDQFGTVQCGN